MQKIVNPPMIAQINHLKMNDHYLRLTSKPIQYVGGGSRKQKDPHNFSWYLDGQGQVLSH